MLNTKYGCPKPNEGIFRHCGIDFDVRNPRKIILSQQGFVEHMQPMIVPDGDPLHILNETEKTEYRSL
eukprot:13386452-Heterocapsa_arctica.AAC.1